MPKFKGNLRGLLEKKDGSDRSSRLVPETEKSQMHQCNDILSFDSKSERL